MAVKTEKYRVYESIREGKFSGDLLATLREASNRGYLQKIPEVDSLYHLAGCTILAKLGSNHTALKTIISYVSLNITGTVLPRIIAKRKLEKILTGFDLQKQD